MANLKNTIGKEIRNIRNNAELSLSALAKKLKISKSYVSQIENGYIKPSEDFVTNLIKKLKLSRAQEDKLLRLIGHPKEIGRNITSVSKKEQRRISVKIPKGMGVKYCDSAFIAGTKFGIVINFAQILSDSEQEVISRIGMSIEHAKALVKILKKRIQKIESTN